MRCTHCGSEWNVKPELASKIASCPFCGEDLTPKIKKYETIEEVLSVISEKFGTDMLADNTKLLAYFSDLAPHLIKQRRLLKNFIEFDGPSKILVISRECDSEQLASIERIAAEMQTEMYVDESASRMICTAFLSAVIGKKLGTGTVVSVKDLRPDIPDRKPTPPQITGKSAPKTIGLSVAECHAKGDNCYEAKDYVHAAEWYRKAAQENYAPSLARLGKMLRDGEGVAQDKEQAFSLFKKAADTDYPRGMFYVGRCYANGEGVVKDLNEAVKWYTKAVNLNDTYSMVNLGVCYEDGTGVEKDYSKAVYYYQMAANQGESLAQHNLGSCYENGKGVEKDYDQAFYWYSLSAQQGESLGQTQLGACYWAGRGTKQDYKEAFYWLQKAAEQGESKAQRMLGVCYQEGKGTKKDLVAAVSWFRKAADKGNSVAKRFLADCYAEGHGVSKDEATALALYDQAFSEGISSSLLGILQVFLQRDQLTEKDCTYILKYFSKNKYSDREIYLIKMCGFFIALDMVDYESTKAAGISWIQLCAEDGKADAQFWLGETYRVGDDLPADIEKARFWLQKAADQDHEKAKESLMQLPVGSSNAVHITEYMVSSLVAKYRLESTYVPKGTSAFNKKISKAIKAYADIPPTETPLLLYDNTLFGSAKEGFVLTDKTIYANGGFLVGKRTCPLSSITKIEPSSTSDGSLHYIDLYGGKMTNSSQRHIAYDSDENSIRQQCKFWNELLGLG